MCGKKFNEEQIIRILKEAGGGCSRETCYVRTASCASARKYLV